MAVKAVASLVLLYVLQTTMLHQLLQAWQLLMWLLRAAALFLWLIGSKSDGLLVWLVQSTSWPTLLHTSGDSIGLAVVHAALIMMGRYWLRASCFVANSAKGCVGRDAPLHLQVAIATPYVWQG
jgi:hypothetical protein